MEKGRLSLRRVASVLFALAMAATCHAQTPAPPPPTAYELLRKQGGGAPGLDDSDTGAWVAASLVGAGCAAGGVAWTLAPHYQRWGPPDPDETPGYWGVGFGVGTLQMLVQPLVFMPSWLVGSLAAHEELAAVQDEIDPQARERMAAEALERLARHGRDVRMISLFLYIGFSGLSIGGYYVGESVIGRNPNADRVGPAYVAAVAAGTALTVFLLSRATTPAEDAYAQYLKTRGPRGVSQ